MDAGKVRLKNVKTGGVRSFDQEHAARILADSETRTPKLWSLNEPKLTFENGKIKPNPDTRNTGKKAGKRRAGSSD